MSANRRTRSQKRRKTDGDIEIGDFADQVNKG